MGILRATPHHREAGAYTTRSKTWKTLKDVRFRLHIYLHTYYIYTYMVISCSCFTEQAIQLGTYYRNDSIYLLREISVSI